MQQYLRDPRVAEVMLDYYAKSKKAFEDMTRGANETDTADRTNADDAQSKLLELAKRVKSLEARVETLEQYIIRNSKKAD
ncbi:MAG: hypothetical protein ACK5WS_05195 [Alphaproteobacteria bacterium]